MAVARGETLVHIIVRIDEMFGGALLQRAPKQPVEASLRLPGMKPGMKLGMLT